MALESAPRRLPDPTRSEPSAEGAQGPWVPVGRLVELCAGPQGARTSAAVQVLREAQAEGDPVAWVVPRGAGLFPPDLAAAGLDLDALVVVHVPPEDPSAVPRAAELLLRSGAFGAVVLDLGMMVPRGVAWQGRLLALAREHSTRVLMLAPQGRTQASLGPLVALRFDVRRVRLCPGRFRVEAQVLKDKLGLVHGAGTAPGAAVKAASARGPSPAPSVGAPDGVR